MKIIIKDNKTFNRIDVVEAVTTPRICDIITINDNNYLVKYQQFIKTNNVLNSIIFVELI